MTSAGARIHGSFRLRGRGKPWTPEVQRTREILSRALHVNHRWSMAVEDRLPQARTNLQHRYELVVARYANARPHQVVVDAGGGRQCPFAKHLDPAAAARIVAVDIDEAALDANDEVDETRVADASRFLPFADAEVDLVVSRSMLEHLVDTSAFARETYRVLKPGGHTIHVFPSKYAPFSLLNRLLPRSLSSKALHVLVPDSKGSLGFPAFYDRTYAGGMTRVLEQSGLEVVDLQVSYYQASYFAFFVPLYMLNAAYELLVSRLGLTDLAAIVLVVARKPGLERAASG
jgi:ubiquinone/menaquinone biosynthesis C-methylase UbiE